MKTILEITENNEMINLGVFANIFCTKYDYFFCEFQIL